MYWITADVAWDTQGRALKGKNMAEQKTATLTIDGKSYELPILSPTAGPDGIDIRNLYSEAVAFTYHPGFTPTAACRVTIPYIGCCYDK